ncbi:MAG TPA: FMN-binding protein [Candidatus Saccharimonadales bacterium]
MRKALVILCVIAFLGVMAATFDPLGTHDAIKSTTDAAKVTTAPSTAAASSGSTGTNHSPANTYKDGNYQGSDYSNPYGDVQVSVTISAGKITAVSFNKLTAEDEHSQRINSEAAPLLRDETLSAQGANIDGVSGASYTSSSYEQSLQSALDKAKA